MKKFLSLLLTFALVAGALAGCNGDDDSDTTDPSTGTSGTVQSTETDGTEDETEVDTSKEPGGSETEPSEDDRETGDKVKTGLGVTFSNKNSKNADGEDNGVVDTQAYVAAVTVDDDGKLVDVSIDALQSRFDITPEGTITTDPSTTYESKQRLGDEYGMRPASPIGKEWNEQADAFEDFVRGMTADEVAGIQEDDADLTASVTVTLSTFQSIVIEAMENAEHLGASRNDKVGIGVTGSAAQTKQEADEKGPATTVAYNYYAASTFDESTVTSLILDASQARFEINEDGTIATDLETDFDTKNQLGDDYGMRPASPIGKEWNEQAAALAEYLTGKSLDEIHGITLKVHDAPDVADLESSVTMSVSGLLKVVDLAAEQAGVGGTGEGDAQALKTGYGILFSNGNSKEATEDQNGVVDTQAYVAAVLVDGEGRVQHAAIDAMMSRLNFDAEGNIETTPDTTFKTKQELGDDYGMRPASPIGKEWDEQADAFAEWVVGKTAEEIAAVSEDDADLVSSVTVTLDNFRKPVLDAIESAEYLGASEGDLVGLGIQGNAVHTKQQADDDGPATAVAYNHYAILSFNGEGVITSALLDASQAKFELNDDGTIATALDAEILTKQELGDDYGMRPASPIGKEWNEQADAFAEYLVGKTANDVLGMDLDEETAPTSEDLTSSVTMSVGGFMDAIKMAGLNALEASKLAARGERAKIGLGVAFDNANSKEADGENEGVLDTQAHVAAVLVDGEGKIVRIALDAMQSRINFGPDGVITTDPDTTFLTKKARGDDYGMRPASPIGREWDEQTMDFATWAVGKTADEILGVTTDDADLQGKVTMEISVFQKAILEAMESAEDKGARVNDYIGLGITGNANQTQASDEDGGPGTAVAYNHYAAVSFDRAGVITASIIDASQARFQLTDEGTFETDLETDFDTKNQLGDDYGMRPASGIEKEWNEQAAYFADYIVGMTSEDVTNIALKEGAPSEDDLASGVTVHIGDWLEAVKIAGEDALAAAWRDVEGGGAAKTGFGVSFSNGNSKNADGDENGTVDTQAYAAGVLIDADGKIVDVSIDAMQSRFEITSDGEILTDPTTTYETKQRLGDDYGMRPASPIGREWNEQANDFEDYLIGMTVDEVRGIKQDDADLASSVTMKIGAMQAAVIEAIETAEDLGASANDKIGLGIVGSAEQTKQADDRGPATTVAYNSYSVTTVNDEGVITSQIFDASQARFEINEDGTIATDLETDFLTKNELKDDYGMRPASPIGREWNEQSHDFAQYVTGKTLDDITGMELNEKAAPTDSDLTSSVTMSVDGLIGALEAAFEQMED